MFANLNIRSLIARMNATSAVISLLMGVAFIATSYRIGGHLDEIGGIRVPSVVLLGAINGGSSDATQVEARILLTPDPAARTRLQAELQTTVDRLDKSFAAYVPYLHDEPDRRALATAKIEWEKLKVALAGVAKLALAGHQTEATDRYLREVLPLDVTLAAKLDAAQADVLADTNLAVSSGTQSATWGEIIALAMTLLALAVGGFVITLSHRRILAPLTHLHNRLDAMAQGHLDAPIHTTSADEIGDSRLCQPGNALVSRFVQCI
jgi:methyl-accepting chemotaxis protein